MIISHVKVGQVWQDNDPRSAPGRKVRVCMLDSRYAHVRGQDAEGNWYGRASRISLDSFKLLPAKTGYRLIDEAPGVLSVRFDNDQLDALRALLDLVHYDDLAQSWRDLLPHDLLVALAARSHATEEKPNG